MSSIPLSLSSYKRALFPEAVLLNALAEPAPTQQEKLVAIRARSGHATFQTVGSSPLRALFSKKGLFGDAAVVLMAQTAYTLTATGAVTALTGTLPGFDLVEIDAGQDADLNSVVRVATGDALYKVTIADGVEAEDFPASGGAGASSVCYHRGFWLAAEAGTDQVYALIPGDTVWNPLTFASAEYAPDPIVAVRTLGEQVWLLGSATAEPFALTGSASPPLAPYGGMVFDIGCRSRASAISMPGALIWVDDGCQVRMTNGGAPGVISDSGLAEQIRKVAAADLRASWYQRDGHTYYQLTLAADATWVYDLMTKAWHRRSALGDNYSRINLFATLGEMVVAGTGITNQLYKIDATTYSDAGDNFPVEFTAFAEVSEGKVGCANLELICNTGDAPWNGDGSDPVIAMRYSDDEGKTWSRWRERPLGRAGESNIRIRWNALGTISAPHGRVFHFRCDAPVGRRFSDLRMNVA